ncbi:DUF1685 domain-containing protein [Cephalotus follicularis]|uniref:DUF1685 domain-containing protein n=1 Tax=Cephalotus follicularis TaxID=3775 RepID=A0A1Q3APE1_CEPFO|nr:DUF1685 domain-containing protein [Cephalotus follicularis]
MEAQKVMQLFDSCWFELEIFKKQPRSSKSTTFEPNPDHRIQEEKPETEIRRILTHHRRSMSDIITSKTSFMSGSLSPDSVLLSPKLHTILSGKEITEEGITQAQAQESHEKRATSRSNNRNKSSISSTKSLSDLEIEELKGFMDLGFVFTEEDRDSSLVEIIPGLQRLGKEDSEESGVVADGSTVSRPYLSEAWEVLEKREKENPVLMNWRFPTLSNEIDMKDNLRWWAHTVAATVIR